MVPSHILKVYQTIIIMFYDPIIFKMIPGIFIAVNNKTKPGYIKIFSFIRDYIYKYFANDLKIGNILQQTLKSVCVNHLKMYLVN